MTPRAIQTPPRLVIWGASGHARVVADIIRLRGEFSIVGFIDDINPGRHGTEFFGSRVLGGREELERLRKGGVGYIVLGFGDCQARLALSVFVREKGFALATAVHPSAVVARDVTIGDGTVIAAGAVINPGARIGENAILNTACSIDHDCDIAAGVHIGPGAHLGGGVIVGQGTWVGIGAVVKDRIRIGKDTMIGAGAVVVDDVPDQVVAYGVPARPVKKNQR